MPREIAAVRASFCAAFALSCLDFAFAETLRILQT
jgi:hypothetical protein